MATIEQPTLYTKVLRITHVYLGPAADRFVARQVQNHLHKAPESLTQQDLVKLIDWIRVAVSLITEDTEIIEEYTSQLQKLTERGSGKLGQRRKVHYDPAK